MSLTNEIKRLKRKKELLEQEGCKQVFNDLLSHLIDSNWKGEISPEQLHNYLRQYYQMQIDELEAKQLKYKQSKINF